MVVVFKETEMTREEIFKKNFPQYVTEKGVCLSPFWDLFDAGIEVATFELNKGVIQVLTKENEELKKENAELKAEIEIKDKEIAELKAHLNSFTMCMKYTV